MHSKQTFQCSRFSSNKQSRAASRKVARKFLQLPQPLLNACKNTNKVHCCMHTLWLTHTHIHTHGFAGTKLLSTKGNHSKICENLPCFFRFIRCCVCFFIQNSFILLCFEVELVLNPCTKRRLLKPNCSLHGIIHNYLPPLSHSNHYSFKQRYQTLFLGFHLSAKLHRLTTMISVKHHKQTCQHTTTRIYNTHAHTHIHTYIYE